MPNEIDNFERIFQEIRKLKGDRPVEDELAAKVWFPWCLNCDRLDITKRIWSMMRAGKTYWQEFDTQVEPECDYKRECMFGQDMFVPKGENDDADAAGTETRGADADDVR